jgi:hypothetical protein
LHHIIDDSKNKADVYTKKDAMAGQFILLYFLTASDKDQEIVGDHGMETVSL